MNNYNNYYNNYAMPEIDSNGDDLFDFEAASSNSLWAGTQGNLVPQAQTPQVEEATHLMPLMASTASNAQPAFSTYFSGFEGPVVD
jgi:hypothetical protein